MEKIKDNDLIYHLVNSARLLIRAINDIAEEDYKKYIDKETEDFIQEMVDANYDLTNKIRYLRNKDKVKDKDLLELNEMLYSLYKNLDNVKIEVINKRRNENGRK